MYASWQQNDPSKQRRVGRSKHGCVTCRRRKVRCNEERPRCSHCRRLQLECTWKSGEDRTSPQTSQSTNTQLPTPSSAIASDTDAARHVEPAALTPLPADRDARFEEIFDYASFLWEDPTPVLWPTDQWISTDNFDTSAISILPPVTFPTIQYPQAPRRTGQVNSEQQLLDNFRFADAPPILAPFEPQLKWTAMRQLITSMAPMSKMVHFAVLSYSALQLQRDNGGGNVAESYKQCQDEIANSVFEENGNFRVVGGMFQHVLAALFLLSYIDLVTEKTTLAHQNLRKAYKIVSNVLPAKLNSTDKRLISWIRSLDARAVTAGGEGLFLQEDIDNILSADSGIRSNHSPEAESTEDTLSDILSKPLLYFFHSVQSFTGRITTLDQWHRHRGTVEDETEVMAAAAQIKKDNDLLYRKRPQIMDLAVVGKLQPPLLSQNIADSLTRSSRIYLANYHATFIHLHRVAYRHLPRTTDVNDSKTTIHRMTQLMLEATPSADSLPVTMLWPLLMWGSEEDDIEQRQFILSTIRKMNGSLTNAKITADVLEEVVRRQDQTGQRVDIRQVMHDTFNMCFAIV